MDTSPAPELIFVYNADSGFAAALFDSAHKLLSPQTYECNLCALTHGMLGPKSEWKAFLESLPGGKRFLHRNEFLASHPELAGIPLPAIFKMNGDKLQLLADGETLSRLDSLDELIARVRKAMV